MKSESEVAQSHGTLRDSMDCGPPGSSDHGIFQARVLEWGAIAFSIVILKMIIQMRNLEFMDFAKVKHNSKFNRIGKDLKSINSFNAIR